MTQSVTEDLSAMAVWLLSALLPGITAPLTGGVGRAGKGCLWTRCDWELLWDFLWFLAMHF